MFAMSVKSVPGCLVLIDPSLIGVPVAFTPGLGPQDDVSVEFPLELAVEVEPPLAAAVPVELLLLLPQAAKSITPTTAAKANPKRPRSGW
jgi:hypothetical protein